MLVSLSAPAQAPAPWAVCASSSFVLSFFGGRPRTTQDSTQGSATPTGRGKGMGEQDSCPSLLLRRCAVSPLSCQASRTAVHLLLDEANFKEAQHGSDMPHSQEGAGGERTQETRAASDDSVAC
jgi:hypothetical protein